MNVNAIWHRVIYSHRSRAIDLLRGGVFSDQDLQLQGRAVGPESLISILEKSELFSDAEFSSSITKDAKTGREKFNISVKLKTDGI